MSKQNAKNGLSHNDCSDKNCVCGGHSQRDVKKNLNHNSTKTKLLRRITRKILNK